MKIAMIVLVMFLAGCAAPMSTVYGKSGKEYTAPDLCAAQIACIKAHEETCSYVDTVEIDEQGNKLTTYCKSIKGTNVDTVEIDEQGNKLTTYYKSIKGTKK